MSESFSLWLQSPKTGAKLLSWPLFTNEKMLRRVIWRFFGHYLSNVKTMRNLAPKFCDLLRKIKLYLRIDFVNPRVSYGRIRGRTALASSMASMTTPAARVKCHLAWNLTTFRPLFHIICQFFVFWHICTFVIFERICCHEFGKNLVKLRLASATSALNLLNTGRFDEFSTTSAGSATSPTSSQQ